MLYALQIKCYLHMRYKYFELIIIQCRYIICGVYPTLLDFLNMLIRYEVILYLIVNILLRDVDVNVNKLHLFIKNKYFRMHTCIVYAREVLNVQMNEIFYSFLC